MRRPAAAPARSAAEPSGAAVRRIAVQLLAAGPADPPGLPPALRRAARLPGRPVMIVVATVVTALRNLALVAFTVEVCRLAWRFLGSAGRAARARDDQDKPNWDDTSVAGSAVLGSLDEARRAVYRCAATGWAAATRTRKKATVAIVPDQSPTKATDDRRLRRQRLAAGGDVRAVRRRSRARSTRRWADVLQDPRSAGRRQRSAGGRPLRSPRRQPHAARRTPRRPTGAAAPRPKATPSRGPRPRPRAGRAGCGDQQPTQAAANDRRPRPRRSGGPPTVERPTQTNESRPSDARQPAAACPADPPNPRGPAQRRPRGAGQDRAPRRTGPDRQEHGHLADGADRDQRPLAAGQAADRPARGDQQPPAPGPRRQGLLHPPDRLRDGAGAEDAPGDEQRLRRGRRQADHGRAAARQPRPGHRPAQARRHPPAAGAEHQELRDAGLRPVLGRVRGDGEEGPGRQPDRRGLRRHHHHADQPGHHRHQPLGAAADAGPGRDHRRRFDGVSAGVPGLRSGQAVRR